MRSALHRLLLFSALWTLSLCGTRVLHVVNELKNWTEAQSYCREKFTDLATIRKQEEMNAVKAAVTGVADNFWIGLREKISWIWSDGSTSSYRDWNTGEPNNNENENCMLLLAEYGYKWADSACFWRNPFVCYEALCNQSLCGTRQFHVVDEENTWTEAQKYCREKFTDLATIETQEDMNAVKSAINGLTGHFWIGLKFYTSWIWSDGSNSSYNNWSPGQPNNPVGDNCGHLESSNEYRWTDAGCSCRIPFVCYKEIPLILIKQKKTWWEALRYCREHHVDLVSVHTEGIQRWVKTVASKASTDNVWVGLRHTCAQGFWFWVSGSTICYENWAPGNGTGVEDCSNGERSGAVQNGSKQWVSLQETQTLNFICTDSDEC